MVVGVKSFVLIDTGASVTLMGHPLYKKSTASMQSEVMTCGIPQSEAAGGNPVPTLGCDEVEVGIGSRVYKKLQW